MASLKRFATFGGGVAPASTDPQFNLTTLLLHGDGTNGAQNNTFIDSSSNNFTLTRNGNSTQGTFTPFSQTGWSNFFDGTGDFLSVPNNSAFQILSGGDYTVEAFVYQTATTDNQVICSLSNTGGLNGYAFRITSGRPTIVYPGLAGASGSTSLIANSWNHVSFVRSGTQHYVSVNGVVQAITLANRTTDNTTDTFRVAFDNQNGAVPFNGYIANLRMIKGQALYTTTFTPPTAPLTAISGTQFLTCQSNRFVDNSTNNFALTRNGDVSVQAFSPFAPTAAYSTSVVGGSGYFDGAGDYISAPDNALLQFETGTFTIQGWIYRAVTGATHTIASKGASTPTGWVFQVNSSNQLVFTHTSTNITTTTTIPANTWTHVAAVRSGTGTNQMVLFINGVSSATGTVATNFNQTNALNIGADRSNASTFNGYISGLEIVKGSALTITVPTSPPTTSNSPSLLLNFTNAGIFDQTAKNNLETIGNAQISTSEKKFGTGSLAFDGNGDVIIVPGRGDSVFFGTGDFTIEFFAWVNSTSVRSYLFDTCPLSNASPTNRILIDVQNNGALRYVTFQGTTVLITSSSGAVTANQWNHIALCKSSGQTRLFLNGTQVGSTYTDTLNYPAQINRPVLGGDAFNNSASLIGYLDELRITRGFARYTANFTPPTAAFADQ